MNSLIIKERNEDQQQIAKQIELLQERSKLIENNANFFIEQLPAIVAAINQLGLSFTEEDIFVVLEKGCMTISATPTKGNSFTFLKHKGYNSKGSSLTETAMRTKAAKMRTKFKELPYIIADVNEYSLILDRPQEVKKVLFTFIKFIPITKSNAQ